MLSRRPHHREQATQRSARSRTFHLSRLFRAISSLDVLMRILDSIRPRSVEEAAARLRCRAALEEAMPYVMDEEGTVRL